MLPRIGRALSRHDAAYAYLPASIDAFAAPPEFVKTLRQAGFRDVSTVRMTFGSEATEEHLDRLNRELLDRLQRGGELFVSNAVVDGRYLLRACIVNYHTTRADVEAVPEIVVRIGRTIDAELRRLPRRS